VSTHPESTHTQSAHPSFGRFTVRRMPESARAVRDILRRGLAKCGVRLDPAFQPRQPHHAG
jgi:hypothetical protein